MSGLGAIQRWLFKPVIPIIRIKGIDPDTTANITRSLQKINPNISKGLALVIDSTGGSAVQAQIISEKIKSYCHEHHLPL